MSTRTRVLQRLVYFGAFLLLGSCTVDRPGPTGVAANPAPNALLSGLLPTGVLQCSPLPYAAATQTVGPEGGTIDVGPHSLVIPKGALDAPVTISAEAPTSSVRSVRFYPNGLQFEKSATLTLSYQGCSLLGSLLRVAYTTDNYKIISYLPSLDLSSLLQVQGRIDHFSTYAVAY